jgi:Domain of unknown function (DUF3883)
VVGGVRVVGGKRLDSWMLFMPEKGAAKLLPPPGAPCAGNRWGLRAPPATRLMKPGRAAVTTGSGNPRRRRSGPVGRRPPARGRTWAPPRGREDIIGRVRPSHLLPVGAGPRGIGEAWTPASVPAPLAWTSAPGYHLSMTRITAKKLVQQWGLQVKHQLYRKDGTWYHLLKDFPAALLDENGYVIFKTREAFEHCPGVTASKTDDKNWANFAEGISSLPDYMRVEDRNVTASGAGPEDWRSGDPLAGELLADRADGLQAIETPLRRSHVQGYEPDSDVRRAVEQRAMALAEEHYRALGFDVQNTATTKPYDFRCTLDGLEVRVEVKGTRGDGAAIEVTIGEVENARGADWRTDLFVVSGILVTRTLDAPVASGGTVRIVAGWRPAPEDLECIRFRCLVC